MPTKSPTDFTLSPTKYPTNNPSLNPSLSPTPFPTLTPSKFPTYNPSINPTPSPSKEPTYPSGQVADHEHDENDSSNNQSDQSSDKLISNNTNNDSMRYVIGGCVCFIICICVVFVFWTKQRKKKIKDNHQNHTYPIASSSNVNGGEHNSPNSVLSASSIHSSQSPNSQINHGLIHRLQLKKSGNNLNIILPTDMNRRYTEDLVIGEAADQNNENDDEIVYDINKKVSTTPIGQNGHHGMIPHIVSDMPQMHEYGIDDEELTPKDVVLLGDFSNIPQPKQTIGNFESSDSDDEDDFVQSGTSKGYKYQNGLVENERKNVLNIPDYVNRKDSLDENAVDTDGYIADEYDEQFMNDNEVRTKGFIKGSIGMDSSRNSSYNNYGKQQYVQNEVLLEGGQNDEDDILNNVEMNGNVTFTK